MDLSIKNKLALDKTEIFNDLHDTTYTFMQDDLAYFSSDMYGTQTFSDVLYALQKLGENTKWLCAYGRNRPVKS